jgi:indolepyruvate ferredoxin oxidoreductase, beta subunit
MESLNIVVCGLGGQGILFVTRILGRFALNGGYDLMGAETHGMAQRGGAVTGHLRLGAVQGSMVRRGTADLLISLDDQEACRNMDFLADRGKLYVAACDDSFPIEQAACYLSAKAVSIRTLPAAGIALRSGAPKAANLVLLGFFAAFEEPPFTLEGLREAVSEVGPVRFREENLRMFDEGRRACTEHRLYVIPELLPELFVVLLPVHPEFFLEKAGEPVILDEAVKSLPAVIPDLIPDRIGINLYPELVEMTGFRLQFIPSGAGIRGRNDEKRSIPTFRRCAPVISSYGRRGPNFTRAPTWGSARTTRSSL